MTFTDIVNEVADRMNLTSPQALTRIGRSVNERYRWLASSIGFDTIERRTATANTVIGSRYVTFGPSPVNVQKLLAVWNPNLTPIYVLDQVSFDTLRNSVEMTGHQPRQYAVSLMGSSSVQIFLDGVADTVFPLNADVMTNLTTLSLNDVPAFAEDYHDALVYGAMATEYDKMEKPELAKTKEDQFEVRVSELRMFIAKSAYLTIYPARRKNYPQNWTPLV